MNFYKCIHFDIKELVDKKTFDQFGEGSWMFFNPYLLLSLDNLRDYFNVPVIVNNWSTGGLFQYRGFRPLYSIVGGDYSQHRFGNAIDCDVKGKSADEIRKVILEHMDELSFEKITCLEIGINWVHFDLRNIPDRIRLVKG